MELDKITINGKNFILVPVNIFQEMMDEIEAIDHSVAATNTIPGDVFHKIILNGENPIKVYREYRGVKRAEIADKIGVTEAYISQIESGKRVGTIKFLKKIAKLLNISLDDIA